MLHPPWPPHWTISLEHQHSTPFAFFTLLQSRGPPCHVWPRVANGEPLHAGAQVAAEAPVEVVIPPPNAVEWATAVGSVYLVRLSTSNRVWSRDFNALLISTTRSLCVTPPDALFQLTNLLNSFPLENSHDLVVLLILSCRMWTYFYE